MNHDKPTREQRAQASKPGCTCEEHAHICGDQADPEHDELIELRRASPLLTKEAEDLAVEVARLRGLLLEAEWGSCNCALDTEPSGCPFCRGDTYGSGELAAYQHEPTCRGYSAKGVVR